MDFVPYVKCSLNTHVTIYSNKDASFISDYEVNMSDFRISNWAANRVIIIGPVN